MTDHRFVEAPGARIHVAAAGDGPLVLLVPGFPDTWRTWRDQLRSIAAAGYRAAAMDVRGYGRSSVPEAVEAYRMLALVADAVAVVRALGNGTAAIVGHDWGSAIAAAAGLLRPEVFTAVGLVGVPYSPPGGPRPTDVFPPDSYISSFQQPGVAEAEIETDVRGWLAGFAAAPGTTSVPPGGRLRDGFPVAAPAWLRAEDLDAAVADFERTGFSGALNRYRNMDRDWEDLAAWRGEPLRQPSLYLAGAEDASTTWLADAIDAHATTLPGLVASHVLEGCGHWVHRERPDTVNRILIDWLAQVRS